jgi:hypothetical protein
VVDAYALLALPRELGRYLFKHGQIARESIRAVMARAASPLSSWSRPWMEAVFADVYACLVVGPAAALYAQDVALALSQDQFIREDDDRLPPILVPKVYARTLERLSLDDWADSLCKRWRDRLLQRRAPAVFRLNVPVAEMCLDHPRDELVVMVDAACDLLQTCAPSPKESWRSFYMHMAAYAPYELEALYSDFLRQLEQLPSMEADEAYSQLGRDAAWPRRP